MIREITGLGLKEAKDLVEGVPSHGQGRRHEGRRRGDQEEARRRRREGRDQVTDRACAEPVLGRAGAAPCRRRVGRSRCRRSAIGVRFVASRGSSASRKRVIRWLIPSPRRSASARILASARASWRCRTCSPSSSIPIASSCRPTAAEEKRDEIGLHAAFKSVFPIVSYSGNATLEYVSYRLGEPVFDVKECQLRGLTYAAPLRVKVRLIVLDKEAAGRQEARQGRARAGGLPRRAAAHDRQRHLRHQRHRARHRLAAAPLARACSSITTAARPTARASCCSPRASFPTAARGSTSSSTRRTACSRASTVAASCRSRSSCARSAMNDEQMLDMFFDKNTFYLVAGRASSSSSCPQRLRGETASSRSSIGDKVIVEEGRRITARHVRQLEDAGVTQLHVPREYLDRQGARARRRQHRDRRDPRQGQRGADRRHRSRSSSRPASPKSTTLYTNDLDRGPYISDTLRIDPTKNAPRGAGRDLPHDASRRAADARTRPRTCSSNLFFNPERYDLSAVGRMKFNRRVGREEAQASCTTVHSRRTIASIATARLDIIDVLQDADRHPQRQRRRSTTSTTSATAACAASARWPRTPSASAWCASSAPSRSA